MDKDQAKFLLNSFRPDGADAEDPDFAEALRLAAEDRDLGNWLAQERAFDANFSVALASVPLPENLLENLRESLANQRGDVPQAEDALDAAIIGALATVRVPENVRTSILAAMDRSGPAKPKTPWLRRISIPLAAAAGIALAFLITRPASGPVIAGSAPLKVEVVEAGFINAYQSPLFMLDSRHENTGELFQLLGEKKLPCPSCLPKSLASLKGIGCRELVVDGKRGSLVCFDENEHGTIHLVIFKREDVSDDLPCQLSPSFTQRGNWATARWCDGTHVFVLIAAARKESLAALF